jgi:hypothetical protein
LDLQAWQAKEAHGNLLDLLELAQGRLFALARHCLFVLWIGPVMTHWRHWVTTAKAINIRKALDLAVSYPSSLRPSLEMHPALSALATAQREELDKEREVSADECDIVVKAMAALAHQQKKIIARDAHISFLEGALSQAESAKSEHLTLK